MIFSEIEGILVLEDNVTQNPNGSCTNKYQKRVACSYGCKLVCVDNKFNKPFKLRLGEHDIYSFINSIIEKSSELY